MCIRDRYQRRVHGVDNHYRIFKYDGEQLNMVDLKHTELYEVAWRPGKFEDRPPSPRKVSEASEKAEEGKAKAKPKRILNLRETEDFMEKERQLHENKKHTTKEEEGAPAPVPEETKKNKYAHLSHLRQKNTAPPGISPPQEPRPEIKTEVKHEVPQEYRNAPPADINKKDKFKQQRKYSKEFNIDSDDARGGPPGLSGRLRTESDDKTFH
eukprot:TRINITY_DN5616_c0_g2_i10.p1 TRINITY_DN5616_c0_g2~~TRINITY_DN5616_c0_g2_i10.p1  ORF type:complete len:211 (-),score=70.11 TRINITY_DN5616_c0_g2_i10:181-813(-)